MDPTVFPSCSLDPTFSMVVCRRLSLAATYPLVASYIALLRRILNIFISWRKTELDISIHWIGWSFHVSAGYIEIPQDKRDKLVRYIQQLQRHSRTPRTYLDKTIGLLMWITQLFPFMRIWIRHLCNDLYTIPCTNYSIDPSGWPQLPECLNDKLEFIRSPSATGIPTGASLVSVRRQEITSKEDLRNLLLPHKRIWMHIGDPSSDKRHLSNNSARVLKMFLHCLQNFSPLVPLRQQPLWKGEAAADAFANADICGIGGFIRTPFNQCVWFSERFVKSGFTREGIPIEDDLQKNISALELLAQMAIVWVWLDSILVTVYPSESVPSATTLVQNVAVTNYSP